MACEWLKMPDGSVAHLNVARGGRKRRCKFCHLTSADMRLCDFPMEHGKTCDAEMCSRCARTLGRQHTDIGHGVKRLNDTIDVCPLHRDASVAGGKFLVEQVQPKVEVAQQQLLFR